MNEEPIPNSNPGGEPSPQPAKKPVIELLRDIHANSRVAEPRHVIRPQYVNSITFCGSLISLILCTTILLMMIWDLMEPFLGFKCIASIFVLLFALFGFRAMNTRLDE